ncbi:Fc.00g076980.m01.CDS01 [Cosmosporella sp. VM-42]
MASSISEAQAELISSLAPDDIPIKLRCAICSRLAVNAYRLPCCDQAICETCQANLPPSCPVCEHSPLSAEDCNPNKSLRTTIRVFLRTAEKKRETSRLKEEKESEPPTPIEAPKPSLPVAEPSTAETPVQEAASGVSQPGETVSATNDERATDAPQPADQEAITEDVAKSQHADSGDAPVEPTEGVDGEQAADESNEQALVEQEQDGDQVGEGQENYDPEAMNGQFPNMNFNGSGDFNQMQMMMAMQQNGMAPNTFGNFPMMGMGMDPMTMQSMYMNGGFQGMGMNGMGGFGGGFGQGSNNNWNGSQSWNFDQNNYNQNGPGMGTGDFGHFNSGFQTGYNQGNYGQINDYRRGGFGRGRGRGRGYYGGYGRGGYQFGGNANYQDQGQFSQHGNQDQGQGAIETNGSQAGSAEAKDVDEYGRALRPDSGSNDGSQTKEAEAGDGNNPNAGENDPSALASRETLGNEPAGEAVSNEASVTQQASINIHQRNGSGSIRSVLAAPDVPINAPTGPKAMRQGLPNTSLLNLRARGYQVGDAPPSRPTTAARDSPAERGRPRSRSSSPDREKEPDRESQRERGKDRSKDNDQRDKDYEDREGGHSKSQSRTGSRSRSRSRGHRSSRRRRRHRSESVEDEGFDDDHRRKKHKSRRHHYDDEEQPRSKETDDKYAERSRSASPDESKRSSHRSRRDRDYDKRRDREKDKDSEKEKYRDDDRKKSSHRSHRDRDYERERRKDRERDRDRKDRKDRHRDRDKDRDREHRHGSSRRHSSDADTPTEKDFKPPTGPRGHDIKASSDRRGSQVGGKDPHTLEREARDRERLLKEAQRIAGLAGGWNKRGREDDGESGSRKGRRTGRRSEAVSGGDEEERMRRLEAEREGGRWG